MSNFPNPIPAILKSLPFVGKVSSRVSHLELKGAITEGGVGGRGLSYAKVASAIEAAFKPRGLAAVALSINSPGGSPVQSRLIYQAIRREADKKNVPVFAFIEDVGASGGYILALAGDEIYADDSSIVGSIGVIAATFGFQEAIARLGVERRVHTAGESKSQLDPFRREDPKDVERLEKILDELHGHFIDLVKGRREKSLSADDDIFTGAFWTAAAAKSRGLIDGIAHLDDFMRARFGDDVRIKKIAPAKGSLLRRLAGGQMSTTLMSSGPSMIDADALIRAVEDRAIWARFGL